MGFIKRFLSLGSRKGKKQRNQLTSASTPGLNDFPPTSRNDRRKEEREQEDAARRLLRSSSAHFTVVSEVDFTSLPPMPHPIDSLSPMPTGASVYSLTPSASPSRSTVQSRGRTYSVKILGREVHTRSTTTESNVQTPSRSSSGSRAETHPAITPHDEKRIHRLRQDPSVASLLDMYDTHGQLDAAAFSNSPEKRSSASAASTSVQEKRMSRQEKRMSRQQRAAQEIDQVGRAQVQRSGSTLRQLLGSPEPEYGDHERTSSNEGDISWAERFLGERGSDNDSSPSDVDSPMIVTPKDATFTLPADLTKEVGNVTQANMTLSTEANTTVNNSAVNSLEVEYSQTSDQVKTELGLPVRPTTPATPARPAAEVFGFLLERRKSKSSNATLLHATQDQEDHPLPPLPTGSSAWTARTEKLTLPEQPSPTHSQANTSLSTDAPSSAGSILEDPPTRAMIITQARAPTPVLLQQQQRAVEVRQSRIPRGPRAQAGHNRNRSSVSLAAPELDTHSTGASTSTTQSFVTAQSSHSIQPPPAPATESKPRVSDEFKTPVKSTRIPVGPREALRSGAANAQTPRASEQPLKMPFGLAQNQGHPKTPKAPIGLGLGHGQPVDPDAYTPVPARRGNRERRIASAASARSVESTQSGVGKRSRIPRKSKENALDLASAPVTEEKKRPRTPDAATLFASAGSVDPDRSADLSPVAQRMMADLRERRKPMRAAGQMAEVLTAELRR
ncbi:unnamed protein product [Peniophora sp. CBMAI 1063]|nr:unnamed protein product [Peniophora sp. CBMAI 1063]